VGRATLALLCVLGAGAAGAAGAAPAAAQQPVAGSPQVIDGPSPDIVRPAGIGMSIARDGTGGLVYLKQVGGVQHVFVSVLQGSFQAPVQVDAGLGASSQPVIAAGNGGVLLVAFVSGNTLYVADRSGPTASFGAPIGLAAGATNPAISMTNLGKAYLAFTSASGGGNAVSSAYYYNGVWALATAPLSVSATDGAGTGAGRPAVAAAGDGVGVVAWGEAGHIFARRVWGVTPSLATEQADATLPGCSEVSADEPAVGAEGNSSFADVAFHEVLACGSAQQSRVLMNRLQGSTFLGLTQPDGLAGSTSDGADDPQITMGEYGHGWVTSFRTSANDLIATALGDDGVSWGTTKVNSLAELSAPDGVPATAGLFSNLIAWQQNPGSSGEPEIHVRYAPAGGTLGPEIVASSSAQGPTDASSGLAAAGDVQGDSAIAWVQGAPGATQIVVDQLYQPPAPFGALGGRRYVITAQPQLSWSQSREPWGSVTYTITLDGVQLGKTNATTLVAPTPLADGPHAWSVTATNAVGQTAQTGAATVFVDTVPPLATLTLYGTTRGAGQIGKQLHTFLAYVDEPPPGEPAANASGVATAVLNWGDGTVVRLHQGWHRNFHAYARPGTYTITATVVDRAGNLVNAVIRVKIKPKPKPKPKPKHKKHAHRLRHGKRR
jgi:hypothetical protein